MLDRGPAEGRPPEVGIVQVGIGQVRPTKVAVQEALARQIRTGEIATGHAGGTVGPVQNHLADGLGATSSNLVSTVPLCRSLESDPKTWVTNAPVTSNARIAKVPAADPSDREVPVAVDGFRADDLTGVPIKNGDHSPVPSVGRPGELAGDGSFSGARTASTPVTTVAPSDAMGVAAGRDRCADQPGLRIAHTGEVHEHLGHRESADLVIALCIGGRRSQNRRRVASSDCGNGGSGDRTARLSRVDVPEIPPVGAAIVASTTVGVAASIVTALAPLQSVTPSNQEPSPKRTR